MDHKKISGCSIIYFMLLKTLLGNGFHFFTFHIPHSFSWKTRNLSKIENDSIFLFVLVLLVDTLHTDTNDGLKAMVNIMHHGFKQTDFHTKLSACVILGFVESWTRKLIYFNSVFGKQSTEGKVWEHYTNNGINCYSQCKCDYPVWRKHEEGSFNKNSQLATIIEMAFFEYIGCGFIKAM